jgi:uncharacterized protein YbjT (DUF2867 family)
MATSTDRKLIAVMGATGAQGGGLARAILDDPSGEFAVRAVTRDPRSEKARELAGRGAEVVGADLEDPASIRRAFEGAHGAYCVTFFWNHLSPEREVAEARTMAQAARDARLRHVIWSTLEDTRKWVALDDPRVPTLNGKYKVPHFDGKGEADRFFLEANVPTTFLLAAFYWENFVHFGQGPKRGADGKLALTLPMGDAKLPGIASADIGKVALGIFRTGPELVGRRIGVAGEQLTGAEMAAAFSHALGEEVRYAPLTPAAYRRLGFPGAEDLANMYQLYTERAAEFCATRDPVVSRKLNPSLQTFEQWLAENAKLIPLA